MPKVIAVTGASGYVGGLCVQFLRRHGHRVLTLGRHDGSDGRFGLNCSAPSPKWFSEQRVDILLHAAWDFSRRDADFVYQRNVLGSLPILSSAAAAGAKVIHLSSMSAWDGCPSVYGRAKRALETRVTVLHGSNLRLGLVWAPDAGGMVGALRKLAQLPVVLVPTVPAPLYLLEPDGLEAGVLAALESPPNLYTVCQPKPYTLQELLRQLAPGKLIIPVTWRLPWLALKTAELAGLHLRSHSDSLLSLSKPNPKLFLCDAS